MKLVDILARELKVWPEGYASLQQSFAGMVFHGAKDGILPIVRLSVSEDFRIASVTRAQWQAAVDALKSAENPGLHPLQQCLRDNGDLIAAQATITQQAQMIEHLRGGTTPGYTAVDMTTAAAQGFRDGVASAKSDYEALRKDSARYQHLKANWGNGLLLERLESNVLPDDWDAEIDRDMSKEG